MDKNQMMVLGPLPPGPPGPEGPPGSGEGVKMLLVKEVEGSTTTPESPYDGTVLIGYGAAHQGPAIGDESDDNRSGSIAVGMGAAADAVAVAVGRNARGGGNHGVAVGTETEAKATRAVAIGYRARGHGDRSVAIGEKSRATQNSAVALGEAAYAAYQNSVALGAGSRAVSSNEVSIGFQSPGGGKYPDTRRLAGVSTGTKPTDAVNLKQLDEALEGIGGEIQLSPGSGQRNLLERQADGYKVDAMRAIIPKFGPEYKTLPLSKLVKTFPNGAVLYRMENKVINQLRYKTLGGKSIPVSVDTRLQQYFLDKEGNVITVQAMSTYEVLDKDFISIVTSVFMSAVPDKAFSLKDDTPYPSTGALEKFSVYLYVLIGSTLEQNGIE